MSTINGAIISEDALTVTVNCKPHAVRKDNPNYDAIITAIKNNDGDEVVRLINFNSRVESDRQLFEDYLRSIDSDDEFDISEYSIKFNGEELSDVLVDKLRQIYDVGIEEHLPRYVLFLKNLYENPSYQSVQELFGFLNRNGLPITEDGHFLAYKTVRNNYYDKHSGTVDNSVGNLIEMPRHKVDDNRDNTCSNGFHVGSWEYAGTGGWYNSSEDRVLLCKVNPRDAVSVPSDHSDQKLRVCRYEVVGEYEDDEMIQSPVYNMNEENVAEELEDVDSSTFKSKFGNVNTVTVGKTYRFLYTKPDGTKTRNGKVVGIIENHDGTAEKLRVNINSKDPSYSTDGENIRVFRTDRITGFEESEPVDDVVIFDDKFGQHYQLHPDKYYTFLFYGMYRVAKVTGRDADKLYAVLSIRDQNSDGKDNVTEEFDISGVSHFEEVNE